MNRPRKFALVSVALLAAPLAAYAQTSSADPTPIGCLQSGLICSGLIVPGESSTVEETAVLPEGVEICSGTQEEQLAAGCRSIEEFLVPGRRVTTEVSAEVAADSVPLPEADIQIDPNQLGLAGLLTTFSTSSAQPVTSSSTVRGYTIRATATPRSYVWDFGDDETATGQSVEHVYESRNTFTVTLTVIYSGSYVWEGNGKSSSGDLGTVERSTSRDYKVIEARGVLSPVT